ncbi:MAG: hypothetical protein HUJ98_11345, partial [Bacteroidaceae bacterium]|nr:hypothetical protein [Bacteroidaceae bacterium]
MKTKYSIIYLRSIGLSILLLLFACFFFSCGEKESGEPQYKVLLLNSYRPGLARTVKSQQLFFDYFEESDVNVDLRVINLEYPNGQLEKQWEEAVETRLDSLGAWKPDLVLLYNDFAVQVTTLKPEWIRAYPVIYGGLTAPDYMLLDLFPNMTGYICPPDYMKNLKFIEEVTGQKEVVVELDYTYTDSLLRNRLMGAEKEFPKDYRIIPVSVGSPARNVSRDAVDAVGNAYLEQMYASAKYYPHLQVMLTPYSNAIMNKTNLPQFTATDVQFADGTARFVGGYFPSLETQVRDIVNYATKA